MYQVFFIHSSVDGHLTCFHVLALIVLQWTSGYICLFGADEPICRAGIEMQTWITDVWTQGKGEGGTNWEIRIDLYTWSPYSQGYGLPSGHVCFWELDHKEGWDRRIDALELWCWRRLLRVPWTARSTQSILKEINPEDSLERLMLKLKLQYFGHVMQTVDSLEKSRMLWKIEDRRRRGHQRMRWLDGITDAMDMNLSKLWEMVRERAAWHAIVHGIAKSRTQLGDWTTITYTLLCTK